MSELHLVASRALPFFLIVLLSSYLPGNIVADPIHDAAEQGDIAQVRMFIDSGIHVGTRDEAGNTPLHWAAFHGNTKLVKYLLDSRAPVNAKNDLGVTALILAMYKNNFDAAGLLITHGADPNIRDSDKTTALSVAVEKEQWDLVRHFILNGANPNLPDERGIPPLAHVTQDVGSTMVKWLVENGASINVHGHSGMTPLHRSVTWGNRDIVKYLIDHGADINARSSEGTPIYYAVQDKQIELVRLLIDSSADVNARSSKGYSPLYFAIHSERIEIVRLLIESGADINIRWHNRPPGTLIELARSIPNKKFSEQAVELLLSQQAKRPGEKLEKLPCIPVAHIERINQSVFGKRIVHIKGPNTRIFIALDPHWSLGEFEERRGNPKEMFVKWEEDFKYLMGVGIDEVIAWELLWGTDGVVSAVISLKDGCVVEEGYGGKSETKKIILMRETFVLIMERGIDDPSVKDSIEKLLISDYIMPNSEKVEKIIERVRGVTTKSSSDTED